MTEPVFFVPSRRYTAGEVAVLTGSTLSNPAYADTPIETIASATDGGDKALVFVEGKRNAALMPALRAAAVLCPIELAEQAPTGVAVLVNPRAQQAFAMIGRLLFPAAATPVPLTSERGISPQAHIDPTAVIEAGAKANHLSYIGDADVGPAANIGAGTITCNYDGVFKYGTSIGAGAFIGSNSALVAPVSIGENAIVGAGSVVTQDVSADALALARGQQSERPGWAARFRAAMSARKKSGR